MSSLPQAGKRNVPQRHHWTMRIHNVRQWSTLWLCSSAKRNSVFIVDLHKVKESRLDLTCDDSGSYSSHSSPTAVVEIRAVDNRIQNINTITRKRLSDENPVLSNENVFTVRRLYSEREDRVGLGKSKRVISKVYSWDSRDCMLGQSPR